MNINDLPPELLVTIFNFITLEDVLRIVSNVCVNWRQLSLSTRIWQEVDLNRLDLQHFITKPYLSKITSVLTQIHYLKASPERLGTLFRETKSSVKLTNLRCLELVPTCVTDEDTIALIQTRCPNLQTIHLAFNYDKIDILKNMISTLSVRNIHLNHREMKRPRRLMSVDMAKMATILLEDTKEKILQYKSIVLQSPSADFLEPFLDLTVTNILVLNAFGRFVSDKTLSRISNASCLTELRLDFSNISNQSLNSIAENNPGLKILSLQCCKLITDKGLKQVTNSCKELEQIYVRNTTSGNTSFQSQITLSGIGCGGSSLTCISAQNLIDVTSTHLTELTKSCKMLTSISLNDCNNLSDTLLEIISQNCALLNTADFSQCPDITLDGVWYILDKCHQLKFLSLLSCPGLTNFSPFEIASNSQTGFSDSFCSEITEKASASRTVENSVKIKRKSKLQILNLAFCEQLEPTALNVFSKNCKDLRNLILRFCGEKMESIESDILENIFSNCINVKTIPVMECSVIDREMVLKYVVQNGKYPCWKKGDLI